LNLTALDPLSAPMIHKAFPGGIENLREHVMELVAHLRQGYRRREEAALRPPGPGHAGRSHVRILRTHDSGNVHRSRSARPREERRIRSPPLMSVSVDSVYTCPNLVKIFIINILRLPQYAFGLGACKNLRQIDFGVFHGQRNSTKRYNLQVINKQSFTSVFRAVRRLDPRWREACMNLQHVCCPAAFDEFSTSNCEPCLRGLSRGRRSGQSRLGNDHGGSRNRARCGVAWMSRGLLRREECTAGLGGRRRFPPEQRDSAAGTALGTPKRATGLGPGWSSVHAGGPGPLGLTPLRLKTPWSSGAV
jgi:hypothetical protein